MKLALTAVVVVLAVLAGVWTYIDRGTSQLLIPLLTAGGIAGVVQSLIENRNVLMLPNRVDDRRFDLGFVSDLLIGMVGAFASLIIGLASSANASSTILGSPPQAARVAARLPGRRRRPGVRRPRDIDPHLDPARVVRRSDRLCQPAPVARPLQQDREHGLGCPR